MLPKVKRTKTPEQALAALMRLCSRAEKSSGDALRLMRGWGVEEQQQPKVLAELLRTRFVDDSRYASAFVREKVLLSDWGAYKIRTALARKGVAKDVIEQAMRENAPQQSEDVEPRIDALLRKKMRNVRADTPFKLREKLLRSVLAQGYAFDVARRCVERAVACADSDTDEFAF